MGKSHFTKELARNTKSQNEKIACKQASQYRTAAGLRAINFTSYF